MPDGTLIRNVPEGTTQSELSRRLTKARQQPTASIGPMTGEFQSTVAGEADAVERQAPAFQRFTMNAEQHAPALLGGAAAVASGGASLPVSALISGLFTGGGELARQKMSREPTDVQAAATEGGKVAAFGLAAGGVLKGLGALAGKLFRSPLGAEGQRAADFAKSEGLPFPLSSAAPASSAAKAQQSAGALMPAYIRNTSDAQQVTRELNKRVGLFTQKADVFDDAARRGQQFLKEAFDPGETAMRDVFTGFKAKIGPDAQIELNATRSAAKTAYERMKARGETRGPLYRRLKAYIDPKGPGFKSVTMSTQEVDDFLRGVTQDTFVKGTTWAEEGKLVANALVRDIDGYGQNFGLSFSDDYAKAAAGRAEYRELRNIPGLQSLSREFGGRGGKLGSIDWMNSMFRAENAKALAKVRELNPPLYHDLADAWLARQIQQFSGSKSELLPTLNGAGLRNWFEANNKDISQFMTKEQVQALDNFSLYAKHMTGSQVAAKKFAERTPEATAAMVGRTGAEVMGAIKAPFIMLPTEGAAFLLARGLSDPNSVLFKAFTTGFDPKFRSFMVKSGQIAGQTAANVQD